MAEKITSIRIEEELWKKAKILAVKRGIVLKNLVEELLSSEVEADELTKSLSFHSNLWMILGTPEPKVRFHLSYLLGRAL